MARELGKSMTICINCTISADGTTVDSVDTIRVSGSVSDPAASNVDKVERGVNKSGAWDGSKTGDQIAADCLASLKSESGV